MRWPAGVLSAGVCCGIKSDGSLDLGLLVFDEPTEWIGSFTRNAAAAAPVTWSRGLTGHPVRALVVNSGNANACTGSAGDAAARSTAQTAARTLGCSAGEILVASTGPIGIPLPAEKVISGIPKALEELGPEPEAFATAILTTDSSTKVSASKAGGARLVGVGKGAAMLAPNMATMLGFIVTDAAVSRTVLEGCLQNAVERTFNRISVDACQSTNDSVMLFSTASQRDVDPERLAIGVEDVCGDLAEQMVRDAEGGSRLVRIVVEGATSEARAAELGRSIAGSVLWRAAAHGGDPNWGRIVAAMGSADTSLDLARLTLRIGDEVLFDRGEPNGSLETAAKWMDSDEFTVTCGLGVGEESAVVLTSDLSEEYVSLNAEGTS
ncbi:MAG: bifunctional glutamate N-acetyltransferase/amino-acid acetyltransferase ArgJ [Actinomycetota bacterium]|jgi:glutamate N-acetyltransferase/amino-acid N-acetyltransferase